MSGSCSDALVLFGATGDLAHGKIFPALHALLRRGHTLRRPPQRVFPEGAAGEPNTVRFRLSPEVVIAIGARAKRPGEAMAGEAIELGVLHQHADEMQPYERLIGDALLGEAVLFARRDSVEAAWAIVDPVLGAAAPPVHVYEPGTWGPPAAEAILGGHRPWHRPEPCREIHA